MRRTLAALLCLCIVCGGCAGSYTAVPVPAIDPGRMPARQQQGLIELAADPYVQLERQKLFFDADFSSVVVLPIRIFIRNQAGERLRIARDNIMVEYAGEAPIASITALDAGDRIAQPADPQGKAVKELQTCGRYTLVYCIPVIILAAPVLAVVGTQPTGDSRSKDYWAKAFWEAVLKEDGSAHGFVFFPVPERARRFREATLLFPFTAEEDGTEFVEHLPLSGLDFGEPPGRAEPMVPPSGQGTP